MEAERELIGCQSRTDVIIRSSRHGATGAFTLHVFQSIISGRENSIVAIHGAKTKSPPHGDLRKRKSPYLIENCSGMPLSKKESFNVVQLLFCKNPSIDQSNCAVVKRQGRHFPQCPSRKSRKEGRTRPCTRQEMGQWATGKNETWNTQQSGQSVCFFFGCVNSPDSTEETTESTRTKSTLTRIP